MPTYEYTCESCGRPARVFMTYAEYGSRAAVCPHCGSDQLKRRISRVRVAKSESARLDDLASSSSLAGVEADDPRALGRFMREMEREMGEDLGAEFDEMTGRLESGESPASIERSMPDLGETGAELAP